MKKVIFAVMLLAIGYSLHAQVVVYKSESTNPAYVVPENIRVDFVTTYPAVTTVTWEPFDGVVTDMWRATYTTNNRITRTYYTTNGATYNIVLPVLSTYVPEEVVTSAINLYGNSLYSITKMKSAGDMEVYHVCLMENSTPRSVWMDAGGVVVTDVYKIKMDDEKLKIKVDNE